MTKNINIQWVNIRVIYIKIYKFKYFVKYKGNKYKY